ncbi:MAG TPA: type 1 glutamine amidotransferase [Streptomyces sp.]|jgi:GMP synthase-like glutamine amidotransferase|nr:type 1 glutamine amidotransferase [Streptomyces sp.]
MTEVLAVQHTPAGGPGRFGDWLQERGLRLEVLRPFDGDVLPERPEDRALLVLGGGYLPDDDARAPWLPRTRALVRAALEHGTPVLGICLGGQLLAHVAGGTVRGEHGAPEAGSTVLSLRPEAAGDPLFGGLPQQVRAIEHHVDAITELPPGARWLMHSERCPYQAFRCGERAWGVQFHPEATAANVARWDQDRLRAQGFDPEELLRTAQREEAASEAVWRQLADRFADVAGAPGRVVDAGRPS